MLLLELHNQSKGFLSEISPQGSRVLVSDFVDKIHDTFQQDFVLSVRRDTNLISDGLQVSGFFYDDRDCPNDVVVCVSYCYRGNRILVCPSLIESIVTVLHHELVHRYHFVSIGSKIDDFDSYYTKVNSELEYYSDGFEIDAYSYDLAYELFCRGIRPCVLVSHRHLSELSSTYRVYAHYVGKSSPVMRRLLKKTYQILTMLWEKSNGTG